MEHSGIYRGEVTHERLRPVRHAFTYPVTFFAFALDELPRLGASHPLFGYNQLRPLQLRDRDFLRGSEAPIGEQLDEFLPAPGGDERTFLVTSPKYFGYAFNPVNFYLRMRGQELTAALAEVNNTFGDRHIYPLPALEQVGPCQWTAERTKDFHVSPFNDMAGHYHFIFRVTDDELFLGVDLHRDGACVMKTWIQGAARPLSNRAIVRHALLHPFDTALNSMPRILWQAARLHYQRRLGVYRRPRPNSPHTLVDRDEETDPGRVI